MIYTLSILHTSLLGAEASSGTISFFEKNTGVLHSIGFSILVLCGIGILASIILYFVAKKFKVTEFPLIDEIAELLPGANCGGCGYSGCRAFAEKIALQGDLEGLKCPVGGNHCTQAIATLLGIQPDLSEPMIASLQCNGTRKNAPPLYDFQGLQDCHFAHVTTPGISGCPFSCLGLGNCVKVCSFDAMFINENTGLPEIDETHCTACGMCVKACPRSLIELRKKGPKGERIEVSCQNKEKGAWSKKFCSVSCIGCGKCEKECESHAITLKSNLAYIDSNKCVFCRKCVSVCPTGAIREFGFDKSSINNTNQTSVHALL